MRKTKAQLVDMIMNPTLEQKMVIACDEEKWQEDIDRIYAEGYEEGVAEIKAEMVKIQEEMVELNKKWDLYCEIIDTDADAWEDLINECDFAERNEDGEVVRIEDEDEEEEEEEEEDDRMVDWKAGEFCCIDYKFRGRCECCNEEGRWVAVDKDEDGKDEEQICCFGCNSGIDEEE